MAGDVIALFGAGVASFLAPCLVPLLPAYLGMLAGEAPGGDRRLVLSTLLFVAGFTAVFAGLGVAAGVAGSALTGVQDGLQRGGGIVVAVLGLVLLIGPRGPLAVFAREKRLLDPSRLPIGPLRPVVIGVAFGAAWSPCVGPLLGAALTVAATGADPWRGGVLLSAYAAGIGVPFVLASLGLVSAPKLASRLAAIGARTERVAGALLVVLGVLLATGAYAHLTSYLARLAPAVGGL